MKDGLTRFIHEDDGQNLVEYALLAGLIALVAIASIDAIGDKISTIYSSINTKLGTVTVQ